MKLQSSTTNFFWKKLKVQNSYNLKIIDLIFIYNFMHKIFF
jgi:hypothetical protein